MCGIAGIVDLNQRLQPVPLAQLARMAGAIRHRGPDEFGAYRDSSAGLAHARLSIVDLATGQQPLSNESGSVWIVFNGEIFNYIELRRDLERAGHLFKTKSDTEVIVHAFEEWGESAFTRFNGQWAVALWDARRATLVLARDPYGICPLYVCRWGGHLYFASEVKAIFAANPEIPRRFDPRGIEETFTFWASRAPRAVFEGVEEIEPGTVRTYENGRVQVVSSWSPSYPEYSEGTFKGSLEDAALEVRGALERATSLRMLRADVHVGSYLSGGLDSSLVAALALQAKGDKFCTFSLRFDDAEYDETHYQRLMVKRLDSEHHEISVSRADIARLFPAVISHTERPILRTSPAPLYLLSSLVHRIGIKVVLTGEGADEVFAGYDIFREAKVRRFWAKQPESMLRPRLLERLYPYLQRSPVSQRAIARQFFGQELGSSHLPGFAHGPRWRGARALHRLFRPELRAALDQSDCRRELLDGLPQAFKGWSPLAQDQFLEVCTLLSGYLLSSQGDRMLMANSVEGRFPFLDPEVTALADTLPPSYKLKVLDEKHVLKRTARDLVPSEILERPKQPYRAPDALSFGDPEAAPWIDDVASPAALDAAGVFDPVGARRLIEKCRLSAKTGQFSNADNMAVVGVLSTQLVHAQLIRQVPAGGSVTFTTLIDRVHAGTTQSA